MYNITLLEAAKDPYGQAVAINTLSGDQFGAAILVTIFIVLLISFKRYEKDTKEALLVIQDLKEHVNLWKVGKLQKNNNIKTNINWEKFYTESKIILNKQNIQWEEKSKIIL